MLKSVGPKSSHLLDGNFTDLYYYWDPRAGAPTNLVRVPGRKDTLEGSNKRSNPNLGETVILTQGRTASPLGLSDINGTGIYLKVMRVGRRLASTSFEKFLYPFVARYNFVFSFSVPGP